MNITIKDIANVAGVSYSTVSKALNNSSLVKEDTKRKIVEIAKEMGYEPNFAAQRLVSKNTKVIGLIWPTIERTVLAALVTKISEEITKASYSMILSVDPVDKSIETFRKFQVDGLILFEENVSADANLSTIPLISYGVSNKTTHQYPIIDANHEKAMTEAVNYLANLGHKKITYIGNTSSQDSLQIEKYQGFKKAMREHQLPFDDGNIVDTHGLDWYDGYTAVNNMLESGSLPTAVVGGSYDLSAGIIRCLRENNLDVPTDISVISYDNIPQMENMEVPMTCIGVSVKELATEIVYSIINLVESKQIDKEINKMTPTLVERASCTHVKK